MKSLVLCVLLVAGSAFGQPRDLRRELPPLPKVGDTVARNADPACVKPRFVVVGVTDAEYVLRASDGTHKTVEAVYFRIRTWAVDPYGCGLAKE